MVDYVYLLKVYFRHVHVEVVVVGRSYARVEEACSGAVVEEVGGRVAACTLLGKVVSYFVLITPAWPGTQKRLTGMVRRSCASLEAVASTSEE